MSNWIVCPIRNGLNLARKAYRTFLAQDIGDVEVLWIDNSEGQQGITEWLCTLNGPVIYNSQAKSVAASWNIALTSIFRTHQHLSRLNPGRLNDYVLVVNNDVELRPDTYRLLVEDGGPFVTAVGVREWPASIGVPDPAAKRPHPDFSCFLIRRECWMRVGRFDEQFKGAFAEDWDYHVRMQKAGITACCLDLPFLHHGSQTVVLADDAEREAIHAQAERNRAYFFSKWGVKGGTPEYYALFGSTAPEEAESQSSVPPAVDPT